MNIHNRDSVAKKNMKKELKKEKDEKAEEKKTVTIKIPSVSFSWKLVSIVLGVLLIGSLFFNFKGVGSIGADGGLPENQISEKVVDYINNNLVQTGNVSFVSMEEVNGMYKITTSYQDREIPVYTTKDGTYLFTASPLDMSEEIPEEEPQETETPEVPKTDKPVAHAFVMSYCPYGLQFLKAYVPVMELLEDKADLELNFVHYAMHDKKELDENTRMYCIQKEQGDKLTDYLRCFVETDDYEKCIEQVGVDKVKLESCISATDEEFKITELYNDKSTWSRGIYPQYPVEAELATEYGVGGSPTFVVNDAVIVVNQQYCPGGNVKCVVWPSLSRSANSIKEAICSAFNSPPEECDQALSTNAESPGIGPIGSGSGSGSSGQC